MMVAVVVVALCAVLACLACLDWIPMLAKVGIHHSGLGNLYFVFPPLCPSPSTPSPRSPNRQRPESLPAPKTGETIELPFPPPPEDRPEVEMNEEELAGTRGGWPGGWLWSRGCVCGCVCSFINQSHTRAHTHRPS